VDTDDSSELCYDDAWTVMMLVKLDLYLATEDICNGH
jgi:hypothetical protein